MRKSFCDRCGNEIQDGTKYCIGSREFYRWRFWFSRNQKERYCEVEHDLCPECQESLWEWWSKGNNKTQNGPILCQDCIHRYTNDCIAEMAGFVNAPDDWFCADGERRTDDA